MAQGQFSLVLRHIRQWMDAGGTPTPGTDSQLLERFVTHQDQAAFAALVQRHSGLIWGVCRRILRDSHAAEDAFQATVVILGRRAATIAKRDALASWLYGVAYRVAVRARLNARKRQEREQGGNDMRQAETQADPSHEADPASTAVWHEAQTVLDEELNRLPEKHRAPLVLCYLDGKTNEEAAGVLNCPVGSMSWRLAQARERLRARLAQRGIALSSLALTAFLTDAVAARVPAALLQSTIQTVLTGATGLSAEVASLVEGVSRMLWATQLTKVAAAVLVVGLLGTGLGVLSYRTMGKDNGTNQVAAATKKEEPAAGPVVNGLQLALAADKTETFMTADGKNAEPVKLTLTFTNMSDKPIKLDAYSLFWRAQFQATGRNPDSVEVTEELAKVGRPEPKATDFPVLQPGSSCSFANRFPGTFIYEGPRKNYIVKAPGEYRLRVTYSLPRESSYPLPKDVWGGAWTGTLASNEFVLKVKPVDEK